ncbi:MAG: rhodanese-like domain-containing protein [Gemmatimonadota bacterium]
MKSASQLINEAKSRIREVSATETMKVIAADPSTVVIDCREPNECNLGTIPGAVVIPRGTLESGVDARVPRDARVIIYCASGNRSALAADTMQQMGYNNVASMSGGFRGWVESGGEVAD